METGAKKNKYSPHRVTVGALFFFCGDLNLVAYPIDVHAKINIGVFADSYITLTAKGLLHMARNAEQLSPRREALRALICSP